MDRLSYLPTVLALFLGTTSPAFSQGDLTPPGAPAPTMKTLDQVEPRTPLVDSSANVSVSATTGAITISASGSYYLTEDRSSSGAGIIITASNVTVDLNGFTLTGTTSFSPAKGIDAVGTATDILSGINVKNGHLDGFQSSINLTFVSNSSFHRLRCSNSIAAAILVNNSNGVTVADCIVSNAGHLGSAFAGIYLIRSSDSAVLRNLVTGVTGSAGGIGIALQDSDSNHIVENQINRLDSSTPGSGTIGIRVSGRHNLIVKNFASGAVDNYSIVFTNTYGPEVSTTGELSNTNPWANFSLNENP